MPKQKKIELQAKEPKRLVKKTLASKSNVLKTSKKRSSKKKEVHSHKVHTPSLIYVECPNCERVPTGSSLVLISLLLTVIGLLSIVMLIATEVVQKQRDVISFYEQTNEHSMVFHK
ncbi:hypothetical protein CO172_03735 [Candidatus Uhrbacteria bacterium CG_4_9_14_3_um_filter_36_7]|uniref:Uncharacterized protein n=1 Tax=Candidatus Uhrbacteria bacterium CG_4_9_14_3_um_filter_36_7 TaxID=1975033 RepID=A0A2M7XF66_9BACT|nr:MAG: hypothetical protein CO172_03735 [Candidatus Uhrbacteria bacterium CG_4_9_14_3_um_filter_36_7]